MRKARGGRSYGSSQAQLRVLSDPLTLAVRADAPWRDISGFIDDAKAHPGEIAYGSSGAYGTLHTAMGMLQNAADIKLRHQPYLGAGPALKALLKGEVQAVPAAPGLLKKHVAEGRLRVLASWGNQRKQPFPDIPTLHQLDFGRMEFNTWAGLFAPSVLPDSLVVRLRDVVRVAVHQQNMVSIFERAGSPVSYRDAPDFETFVASEQRRFLPILRGMAESEHRVAEDKPK